MFPVGRAATIAELTADPYRLLATLRGTEPVSWVPELDCWLVTRHDLPVRVVRDARTFTVADPRFSTAQVVGPSMLSLDGAEHTRHRACGSRRVVAAAQQAYRYSLITPARTRVRTSRSTSKS